MMKKRGIAVLLAGMMLVASPLTVLADREDAKLNIPYVSLGADLNTQERETVLRLLDAQKKGVEELYGSNRDKSG